jgi:hypothetical protein
LIKSAGLSSTLPRMQTYMFDRVNAAIRYTTKHTKIMLDIIVLTIQDTTKNIKRNTRYIGHGYKIYD